MTTVNRAQPCISSPVLMGDAGAHSTLVSASAVAASSAAPDPRIEGGKRSFYWPDHRDKTVNRNPTPIPTATGTVEKMARCRHFAITHLRLTSKEFFAIVNSVQAIQHHFGGDGLRKAEADLEAFFRDPRTHHCMVGNEGFGPWVADIASAMLSQGVLMLGAILNTRDHMMSMRMQWMTNTDGARGFCASIHESNHTTVQMCIEAASADELRELTLMQCLDNAALHSVDGKGETLWVTASYPDVKLAQADGAHYLAGTDFSALSCVQALCEAVQNGLGPAVTFLGKQFLKLSQSSDGTPDRELCKSRLQLADLSFAVFQAMLDNRPGALGALGKFLKWLDLPAHVIVPIAQGRDDKMHLRGLPEAMHRGHHQFVMGYGQLIKPLSLGITDKFELLIGRDPKAGLSALQIAMARDDAAGVLAYGRMLEPIGMDEEDKARLLTVRTAQGEATVQVAMRMGSYSALRAYAAVLLLHLPPQLALDAMTARDEHGVPALFYAYHDKDIGAIATFAMALVESGFSRTQALQLFDAEVPQDQRKALGASSGYSLAEQGPPFLKSDCSDLRKFLQKLPELGQPKLMPSVRTEAAI